MERLNSQQLARLPAEITTPQYDRNEVDVGIVHIGPGAFHRSHQAYFTDRALQHGGDWGICGVSLNSTSVRDALTPQNGLYTLAIQQQEDEYQVIGSLLELLQLEEDRPQVMARLCNSKTKVVTLTITEKGYCLDADGNLDINNPAIVSDLRHSDTPSSAIGLLVAAISLRREKDMAPFIVISCDNVTENGHKLRSAVMQFCQQLERQQPGQKELANYIERNMHFPCTMVDSITPATDDKLTSKIADKFGYIDEWPIKREPFAQWVIEQTPVTDLPAWNKVGVTFTDDIDGYENAKLRLLNLPHSALAYMGSLLGLETVYDAISQPQLIAFVRRLVDEEVIPSFAAPMGLDLDTYRDDIIERFQNPSIKHLLAQIAYDGSQKLQMRLIPIVKTNLAENRSIERLCLVLAAWMKFAVDKIRADEELVDPLAKRLRKLVSDTDGSLETTFLAFLSFDVLFDQQLVKDDQFTDTLRDAFTAVTELGIEQALTRPLKGS